MRVVPVAALLVGALATGCSPTDGDPVPGIDGAVHRFAERGGVRWHWVEAGQGRPLVLLHGLPETWNAWVPVLPTLADDFRVLAFDLEGMGDSTAGDGDYSIAAMAAQIAGVLEETGVHRFRLAGHDWGGLVGARLAGDRPERIVAYAHIAAPVDVFDLTRVPDYQQLWLTPAQAARFVGVGDVVARRIYDRGVRGGAEALPAGVLERRMRDFGRAGVARAVARWFRDLELDDRWRLGTRAAAAWERMDFPVLAVVGDRDLLTPSETFLGLEERVPGPVSLRVIDDAGHYPVTEQPAAVAAVLVEFFAGGAVSRREQR